MRLLYTLFRPKNLRLIALALAIMASVSTPHDARSADPQPYQVTLEPTKNSALDAALKGSSTLISLRKSAPVSGFALVQRAREDEQRLTTVLHSFGYYKATVHVTIDGHPLDDPALPGLIEAAPAQPPLPVVVSFDLGPQFTLGNIQIEGPVPPDVPSHLQLKSGEPALAEPVLAAQGRLLTALKADGYPLAKVPTPVAILHPERNQLDVTFHPKPGPHAEIGPIKLAGLQNMNESFVRNRLLLHPGEQYSPAAIEKARADLASLGTFSVVRAETANHLNAQGQIPITFNMTERPLHAVDFGVGYSTDLGVDFSAGWHDRNLFGNAEQLNLTATADLGGRALRKPSYNATAQFLKPDFLARDQTLEMDLTALKESLQAYDQTALLEKLALNRKLPDHWFVSLGLTGEQESIFQENETRHYNLVGLPATIRYDSTNSLLDPTRGIKAAVTVTPTQSLGQPNATFLISQANASTYFDLSGGGRTVLALRGLVGEVFGEGVFGLPPDQRFYAGGSGTIRGYRYQSVGPQFRDGQPTGGIAISTGTIELRQRFMKSFGVVGFLDVGQVSATGTPFSGTWRAGAGVGARYYTSIGPIRVDIAVPLNKERGGDSFELYIGIGQAF